MTAAGNIIRILLWVFAAFSLLDVIATSVVSVAQAARGQDYHPTALRSALWTICLVLALGFLALADK